MERRQFIYHTDLQSMLSFVGLVAELTVDDIVHTIRVHDGSTAGGWPLAKADLSNISVENLKAALKGNISSDLLEFSNSGIAYVSMLGKDSNDGYSQWTAKSSLQGALQLNPSIIQIMDTGNYQLSGDISCSIIGERATLQLVGNVNQLSGFINVNVIQSNGFSFLSNTLTHITAKGALVTTTQLIDCTNGQQVMAKIGELMPSSTFGLYKGIKTINQILNPPTMVIKERMPIGRYNPDLIINGAELNKDKYTYLNYIIENNLIPNYTTHAFQFKIVNGKLMKPLPQIGIGLAKLMSVPRVPITFNTGSPWVNDKKVTAYIFCTAHFPKGASRTVTVDNIVQSGIAMGGGGSSSASMWQSFLFPVPPGSTARLSGWSYDSTEAGWGDLGIIETINFSDTEE